MRTSAVLAAAAAVLLVSALLVCGTGADSVDDEDSAGESSSAVVALLEAHADRLGSPEMREAARQLLLSEYSLMEEERRAAALIETHTESEAVAEAETGAEAEVEAEAETAAEERLIARARARSRSLSRAESDTDANSGARLSPVDTPTDLWGAPRMTPACRRQLHNYLTDCVFDGKSKKANSSRCRQVYAVWSVTRSLCCALHCAAGPVPPPPPLPTLMSHVPCAVYVRRARDCFNGGTMPSERE
jgi:hypothetical protein